MFRVLDEMLCLSDHVSNSLTNQVFRMTSDDTFPVLSMLLQSPNSQRFLLIMPPTKES